MRYSSEIIRRARARLAQQRADRESMMTARLQEVYGKQPRIRQIDKELRSNMASAIQKMLTPGQGELTVAEAREKNKLLEQERRQLLDAHFPPDYLDESPICDACGGSGYVGSSMCRCLQELCLQEQRKELGAIFSGSMSFESFRLDYYSELPDARYKVAPRELMRKNLEHCRQYSRNFGPDSGNLLFIGGTGLGKTHLALAVGRDVGEQGYSVCYETAISLFSKLEKARFTPTDEIREQVRKMEACDLLIIDDLGTEMPGQFVTAALYGILNERLMNGRAMLITTNLNVDEAGKRYSPQIASRLYGEFLRLTFLGTDIRVLKNKF